MSGATPDPAATGWRDKRIDLPAAAARVLAALGRGGRYGAGRDLVREAARALGVSVGELRAACPAAEEVWTRGAGR